MKNVVTLVLGGGQGTRLYPLTKFRSKPAVPVAGKYRLIDIPLSNCINSGLNRIYVLTQFNSVSLHRHIRSTYTFDPFDGGFVEILAAQQTLDNADWYQGTADAVRQNLRYVEQPGIEYVLILSGDQLYRMNFRDMIATHIQAAADVTIAAVPVHSQRRRGLGHHAAGRHGPGRRFSGEAEDRAGTRTSSAPIRPGSTPAASPAAAATAWPTWASTCSTATRWSTCSQKTDYRDFGKEVFPASIRTRHVQVHLFDGYWEDIGTIKSFYEANLGLASPTPPFDLASAEAPIYSRARFLPPTRIDGATIRGSLMADGSMIEEGAVIENSVIGLRCRIGRNVVDSQFDPDGQRLLRNARRDRRPPAPTAIRRWASARARTSKARSSTRTAASAATCGSSTSRASTTPRKRPSA